MKLMFFIMFLVLIFISSLAIGFMIMAYRRHRRVVFLERKIDGLESTIADLKQERFKQNLIHDVQQKARSGLTLSR